MSQLNNNNSQKEEVHIIKASGEKQQFSTEKLRKSLLNAGADQEIITKIIDNVIKLISPEITSKMIYDKAFEILRKEKHSAVTKYRLKNAMYEMGPSGYPFETLVGRIFDKMGYNTEVGIVVPGFSITHEMDVIATKNAEQNLVECKYHKDKGRFVSIQVPLYVRSRVNDIVRVREKMGEYKGFNFNGWVITNTRFSEDSIQYSSLNNLRLMGWDFPINNSLKEMVEKHKIYPITILNTLSRKEKEQLLQQKVVTCDQLHDDYTLLEQVVEKKSKLILIKKEIELLLK